MHAGSCITPASIASIDGPYGCYLSDCATYGLAAAQDGNPLTALRTGGSAGAEPSVDFVLTTPTKRITEIKLKGPAYVSPTRTPYLEVGVPYMHACCSCLYRFWRDK